MMKKIAFVALVFCVSFISCLKKVDNCSFNACGIVAPANEVQAIQSYLTSKSITATQHCSGLFYRIENPGSGGIPLACGDVAVTYKGYLTDGTVFDKATDAVGFNLSQVIKGWRIGIPLIKSGGRIILFIPPSLGYGAQEIKDNNGTVVIPANSYLIFEVDLVAVA